MSDAAVDRFGARRVLLGAMVLFVAAAAILGLAPNYGVLVVAAVIAGIGNCVFHPADFTLLNRNISTPRLGHAFSVHGLSGNLGWALAPVFMTSVAVASSWRIAAFAAASVALVAFVLIWLRRETMTESSRHEPMAGAAKPPGSAFAFLGSGAVWMCFFFFFFVTMGMGGLQNFAPSLLHELYGMSLAALVLVLAALVALGIASGAVPAWSVTALMAGMGFCAGLAGPSRDMLVRRAATTRFGQRAYGRVYGFVYSGLDAGLAAAPVLLFGPLMDAGLFRMVFVAVAALYGLAVLTALGVGRGVAAPSSPA
jgi:MFS family permease